MRALCVADNHVGAGSDLGRAPGDRLTVQEEIWRAALALARSEGCDVVLHGGDLFHYRRPTPEQVLAATRPLVEHRAEGGCPVVMALGNHERSGASEETMPAVLSLSEFLHVAHSPEIVKIVDGTLTSDLAVPGGVAICLLPWAPTARLVAAQGGGDRDDVNAQAAELLVSIARGLREQVDGPAILLTHFSISGSSLPNGLPVEQLREPVIELGELEALGFDAIVAGHIHAPQEFASEPSEPDMPIFFTGSPMPLNFGEAGTEHGVWILESHEIGSSGVLGWGPQFVPLESRPLVTLDYSVAEMTLSKAEDALQVRFATEGAYAPGAIVRVRIACTAEEARRIDVAAFKRALYDHGAHHVSAIQLEIDKPERARVEGLTEELDEMAALDLWLDANDLNGSRADELRERTERYLGLVRA